MSQAGMESTDSGYLSDHCTGAFMMHHLLLIHHPGDFEKTYRQSAEGDHLGRLIKLVQSCLMQGRKLR